MTWLQFVDYQDWFVFPLPCSVTNASKCAASTRITFACWSVVASSAAACTAVRPCATPATAPAVTAWASTSWPATAAPTSPIRPCRAVPDHLNATKCVYRNRFSPTHRNCWLKNGYQLEEGSSITPCKSGRLRVNLDSENNFESGNKMCYVFLVEIVDASELRTRHR